MCKMTKNLGTFSQEKGRLLQLQRGMLRGPDLGNSRKIQEEGRPDRDHSCLTKGALPCEVVRSLSLKVFQQMD